MPSVQEDAPLLGLTCFPVPRRSSLEAQYHRLLVPQIGLVTAWGVSLLQL